MEKSDNNLFLFLGKITKIYYTYEITKNGEELCSRIIMIDEGKKIYDGSLEKLKDTYGTTRKISMEVRKLDQFKELRLAEKLGVSEEECRVELEKDKSVLTVTFDKHKVMVPQIMNAVMEVSEVFEFLPFSSMVYTPVMIYLGKYSGNELWFVLLRQAAWVVILYVLGDLIWRRVTKRLVVLGG